MTASRPPLVSLDVDSPGAVLALNDPARRNALSINMFEALDTALNTIEQHHDLITLILRGEGEAFCAGFDLEAAANDISLIGESIGRLSHALRHIRRLPLVVIASVHGAAIAGGCALLSACDFVVVEPDAKLGYPVHAIGISPAVTIPTLRTRLGDGRARDLLMGGRLLSGGDACHTGLATHLAREGATALDTAIRLAQRINAFGHQALRATKAWLNELDGSLDDDAFDAPARASALAAQSPEVESLLQTFWTARQRGSHLNSPHPPRDT